MEKACKLKLVYRVPARRSVELKDIKMTKNDIISASVRLFQRYGIKSVTMDDIAHHLGASKKTLYTYFNDKEELLLACIDKAASELEHQIAQVRQDELEPVDSLAKIYYLLLAEHTKYQRSFFFDMKRMHAPSQKYQAYKEHVAVQHIMPLLKKAVQQKSIRQDVDANILCRMLFFLIDEFVAESSGFNLSDSFQKLYNHIILINLKGCLTSGSEHLLNHFLDKPVWKATN